MEDYYSAQSEATDSDTSSECGYQTAFEGLGSGRESPSSLSRRSDSLAPHFEAEVSCGAPRDDKVDFKQVLHILHTLNDCIWCTNVFVAVRFMERSVVGKSSGCFRVFRRGVKNYYPDEDIRKELEYIEYLVDILLKTALPLVEKIDYGCDCNAVKNLFSEPSRLFGDISSNGVSDRYVEASKRYSEKASEVDKLLHDGQCICFDEKTLNVMFRAIRSEVETVENLRNFKREVSEEQPIVDGKKSVRIGSDGCEAHQHVVATCMEACTEALDCLKHLFAEGEVGDCVGGSRETLAVLPLKPIDYGVGFSKTCARIWQKTRLANFFLRLLSRYEKGLEEEERSFSEELARSREKMREQLGLKRDPEEGVWDTRRAFSDRWGPCSPSLSPLLFEKEKWRLRAVEACGGDPLEHLGGVSLPLDYDSFKSDTRATYYGIKRKNMLSISLQTADMSEKVQKSLGRKIFDLMMLLLSISLYFSDLVSDLVLAGDHYAQGNKMYSYLTLTFVFAPYIGETLSKLILKSLGWDKEYGKLEWKDVFNFNDFKIMKWMACSMKYSLSSMRNFQRVATCYAHIHSHRCSKGKKDFGVLAATSQEADSTHIHHVYYSMIAWNERFMLQTKLAESLNEAAPQLLLQLVIVFKEIIAGNSTGFKSWFCIVTSTLSLSWSMHMSHFNRHYHSGGRVLNNSYKWKARILEFIGNFCVYGSRLLAICMVTSLHGVWFVVGALIYLTVIYLIMLFGSKRKEIYKTLHRYKTTIFWPFHRLFTVPYRIGVWRMDSSDHLLYYSEIVFLALLTPFILPEGIDQRFAWGGTGMVLSLASVGVALLFAFKRYLHPYGYVCENR